MIIIIIIIIIIITAYITDNYLIHYVMIFLD